MLFEPAQRIKGKSRRERSLSPLALYVLEPPVTVAVVRCQGRNPNLTLSPADWRLESPTLIRKPHVNLSPKSQANNRTRQ